MVRIKLTDVWENLVSHYYEHVLPVTDDMSIWDFVKEKYNGERTYRLGMEQHQIQFVFENDSDATAFKLKFLDTDCT